MEKKEVYHRINKIQKALAKEGIAKAQKNKTQGYSFRGIDDVYNSLAPLLAEHALCILPRVVSREVVERKAKAGGALFSVTVECEFDFVASYDGSCHTIKTYGEAMDSGDKATNKAMSAAFKYACFLAFCIPTEGDNDADSQSHDVAAPEISSDIPEKVAKDANKDQDFFKIMYEEKGRVGDDAYEKLLKEFGYSKMVDVPEKERGKILNFLKKLKGVKDGE